MSPPKNIRLAQATPEQIRQTWAINYPSWGAPRLSRTQYIGREEVLAATTFGQGRSTWVLLGPDGDEILSACETYPRTCWITRGDGEILERECLSIASVYTAEKHRRNGYAAAMLKFLREEMEKDSEIGASTLYSDVGKEYYSKLGWGNASSFVGTFSLSSAKIIELSDAFGDSKESEIIADILDDDIRKILGNDSSLLMQELKESTSPSFIVPPTVECVNWIHVRADYYASVYKKNISEPSKIRGAKIKNSNSFVIWSPDWIASKLVILRFRASSEADVRLLIGAAAAESKKNELSKVLIWNPDVLGFFKNIYSEEAMEYEERAHGDSQSAVMLIETDFPEITNINWIANEKFAWV